MRIKVPTVEEIMDHMIEMLPYELQRAARLGDSNIHGLLRAMATAQEETLTMMQEMVALIETKQEDKTLLGLKSKIQRKGAYWAP